MATISNGEVEALARQLLREQLECSPWFRQGLSERQRMKRIQLEVDAWWHLMIPEASQQLVECAITAPRHPKRQQSAA